MKKLVLFSCVMATVALANAALLTYNYDKPLSSTDWTQSFNIQQFDPGLGTLNSVSIAVDGELSQTFMFENFNGPGSITFSINPQTTTGCLYEIKYTAGSSLVSLDILNTPTYSFGAYDGVMDFGGTSGKTDVVGQTGSNSATFADAATLAGFTGLGSVGIDAKATGRSAYSMSGGNGAVGVITNAGADITVIYDYTIPEPATMVLLGLGGLLLRKRG